MKRIIIPKVDANIEEGALGSWMAAEGDAVRKGQSLVEYITDKAVFEIEAPASGHLRKITAPAKSIVPIGTVIGLIGRPHEPLHDIEQENQRIMDRHRKKLSGSGSSKSAAVPPDRNTGSGSGAAAKPPSATGRPRATLAARRLARRKGISLEKIQAEAGGQLITVEMVEQAET